MGTIVEAIEIYGWLIIHMGRKHLKLQADDKMIQIFEQMHSQSMNAHVNMCCDLSSGCCISWFGIYNCDLKPVISLLS